MTDYATEIQERMRHNAAENYPRLAAFGIFGNAVPVIACQSCGHTESSVFWSATGITGSTLRLRCPVCDTSDVWYDLARNVVRRSAAGRRVLAIAAVVILLSVGVGAALGSRIPAQSWDLRGWLDARAGQVIDFALGNREEVIYLASGDRKSEVARHLQEIATAFGAKEAGLLRNVSHVREFDQTRLILAHDSRSWRNRLAICGWERAGAEVGSPNRPTPDTQNRCAETAVARK